MVVITSVSALACHHALLERVCAWVRVSVCAWVWVLGGLLPWLVGWLVCALVVRWLVVRAGYEQ